MNFPLLAARAAFCSASFCLWLCHLDLCSSLLFYSKTIPSQSLCHSRFWRATDILLPVDVLHSLSIMSAGTLPQLTHNSQLNILLGIFCSSLVFALQFLFRTRQNINNQTKMVKIFTGNREYNPWSRMLKTEVFKFLRQFISNLKLNFLVTWLCCQFILRWNHMKTAIWNAWLYILWLFIEDEAHCTTYILSLLRSKGETSQTSPCWAALKQIDCS